MAAGAINVGAGEEALAYPLIGLSNCAGDDSQRVGLAEADALRELRRQVGAGQPGKAMSAVEVTKQKLAEQAFAKDVCTMKGVTCADGHVAVVSLRKTGLAGTVPLELQMFSRLKSLDLSHNELSGPIPRWITNFRLLEKLNLAENRLSGGLPVDIGNLGNLDTLIVADNELSGVLPNALSELQALRRLDIAGNGFAGPIPSAIGALPNLQRANWQHGEARRVAFLRPTSLNRGCCRATHVAQFLLPCQLPPVGRFVLFKCL